ncbi:MAG: hypothetical protein K0U74_05465 [Alphaproteobacteria bacterium]|nr:hypothetical protein [Alphaproteobacteria bacterium]
MSVRFFRLSYLLWLVVPVGIYLVVAIYGWPHLRWSYSWRDDGQGYEPFAKRFYVRCTYLGPTQAFTLNHPENGHCPLIRFAKTQGGMATSE